MAHLSTLTDPLAAFDRINRVIHVHLSDGQPPIATHRPLGMGKLPFQKMVAAALARDVPTIAIEGRWREDEELALDRAARELAGF
jgi:sugar phosphate isomerase/epimerase